MSTAVRCLIVAGFVGMFAFATTARAQNTPPIKPGLWDVQVEHEGGPKMPDMNERMKNMPPEQRKKIEMMMKEHGVGMSGGPGTLKICLNKESIDRGHWQGEHDTHCKTEVTNMGSTNWKWQSMCGEPYKSVSDGEATFTDPEHYIVKTSTTMTVHGETKTAKSTIKSTWIGSDCGDVKPVRAMKYPLHQAPKEK
ncbi:MAG: DUF3617 domain-containing protein [Burkholderiales bacterium]|jgi:hypothetical protein|nr:DUF3617 domain-containing protein [Burkholderiales bacterium]